MFREPASVLFAMVQPLVFLGLFAPLLPEVESGSALQWFVPGIIAMTALMGASFTGANLTQEIMTGSHERLLVSPLSRSSLLVGRALKEVVPMLMQAVIILLVVTPFSFDLHLGGVLVGLGILALFSIGVGALSFALALASKDQEWMFWTVQQTAIFPVLLLAGVLLPLEGAPGWLPGGLRPEPPEVRRGGRACAVRRSFPVDIVAYGFVGAGVVAALGLAVGLRAMKRSSADGLKRIGRDVPLVQGRRYDGNVSGYPGDVGNLRPSPPAGSASMHCAAPKRHVEHSADLQCVAAGLAERGDGDAVLLRKLEDPVLVLGGDRDSTRAVDSLNNATKGSASVPGRSGADAVTQARLGQRLGQASVGEVVGRGQHAGGLHEQLAQ